MAKGFGVKPEKQLGYVLQLSPEANAYAIRLNYDGFGAEDGEEFIGITNMLEEAQVWKAKEQAKQSIEKYADFLLQQIESGFEPRVDIKRLKRSSSGELSVELVESSLFIPNNN